MLSQPVHTSSCVFICTVHMQAINNIYVYMHIYTCICTFCVCVGGYVQMLCLCIYRKMCPKCCVDSSVSFGEKINYYMHNIYISITNTNLEAIKFIELTFYVFYCLYFLSLYCRLLAAVQNSSSWSFWLQSGERSTEAVRTTVFSKSTFILSYYDMVWSPWKLQWNFFFPTSNPLEVVQHIMSKE